MAKYKVNLDRVWNLPIGTMYWNRDGKYCALGLVAAGALGKNAFRELDDCNSIIERFLCIIRFGKDSKFKEALWQAGIDAEIGINFDHEIFKDEAATGGKNKEAIRSKYVKMILEKGLAANLFELEGETVNSLLAGFTGIKDPTEVEKLPVLEYGTNVSKSSTKAVV